MRARRWLSVALVGVLAFSLTGCDQIKKAIAPPPKITHVTIKAKVAAPGAKTGVPLKNVPENLPVWPDSSVVRGKFTKAKGGNSWSVTLSTGDPYADVVAGTVKGFEDAGWQAMQQDVSSADTSITVLTVSSSSGEGVVTITAEKDKSTQIGYVIATPSK